MPRTQMGPDVSVFEAPRWARGERVKGDEPVTLTFFLKHCPFGSQVPRRPEDIATRPRPTSGSGWTSRASAPVWKPAVPRCRARRVDGVRSTSDFFTVKARLALGGAARP